MRKILKKFDKNFNYDYLETVWNKWENNKNYIEKKEGVFPIRNAYSKTIKFNGSYPESIKSHKLFKKLN